VILIRVKTRQRVDRAATFYCQNRCYFNMAKGLREPAGACLWVPPLSSSSPMGQVPERVETKASLLMLAGHCILRTQIERILGLLVKVRCVVECL
jgi:hypothetical protein